MRVKFLQGWTLATLNDILPIRVGRMVLKDRAGSEHFIQEDPKAVRIDRLVVSFCLSDLRGHKAT